MVAESEVMKMARQTKVQIFRETATDEQWQRLVDFAKEPLEQGRPIGSNLPSDEFPFSWGAIKDDCAERNLIEKSKKRGKSGADDSDTVKVFVVHDITSAPKESVTRSIEIKKDVDARLRALENSKRQYTHRAILEQLLTDILDWYGYPDKSSNE